MKFAIVVALLFGFAAAQYGPSATAIAAAAASIDDIVSASALAAASATGDGASADAAAAAAAGANGATAEAAAAASAGTTKPAPPAKIITPTHTKYFVVPVVKEARKPAPKPTGSVIYIKKEGEKTCDMILDELLECADAEEDSEVTIPYECLESTGITIEDLVECGYIELVPEEEKPEPAKKAYAPVVYKKVDPEPEPVAKKVYPTVTYPKYAPAPKPTPVGATASATATAAASGRGAAAASQAAAAASGGDAAALALATAYAG
eukprot:TRINITY_DN683_c1_g1_i1.p1 TRINITY_DN683_c1_g1~~TRINITY_DN683_c1_g1_i1.p1  ORF type:complete len:265 (-),score=86.32 TRINITY_DN683_c1_g1_i1:432-1226(-)